MQNDHNLIQQIYDASLHPDVIEDLLQQISERVGAYGAMIFDCTAHENGRRAGLQHLSSVYDRDATLAYVAQYNDDEIADQDRLADLSSPGNRINLIHDRKLFSDDYKPGPNVDAMKRRGISDRIGGLLNKEIWNADRFAFQFLSGSTLPGPEGVAWAEEMLAHLGKALSIGRAVETKRLVNTAFDVFLNSLPFGLAVVQMDGQIAFQNTEFKRLVQDQPEISILPDGRLRFDLPQAQASIEHLLFAPNAHGQHGARPRQEAVFAPSNDGGMGLFIEVCPLSGHPDLDNFGANARLISVFDGKKSLTVDTEQVARFFPLSKSELMVLGLVSEGYSNNQIAEARSRSVETVNSQIKSILRKTNTRNRTELVKVAMGLSGSALPAL